LIKQGTKNKVDTPLYLLLGTNLGNKKENLKVAIQLLEKDGLKPIKISSVYETEAWGKTDQPAFLNQVVYIKSALSTQEILRICQNIEKECGRVRVEQYGPRLLDIDILYFDDAIIVEPGLVIPHQQIQFRNFTLVPLVEIAPDFKHPVLNVSNLELLQQCKDTLKTKKLEA